MQVIFQSALGFFRRGLAVQTAPLAAVAIEAELGGDDHLLAERGQRLTYKIFGREWAITDLFDELLSTEDCHIQA
jgi:hypothetical protein